MKQTLKRRICAAILCHILLLGLAGCGKANKAKPNDGGDPPVKASVDALKQGQPAADSEETVDGAESFARVRGDLEYDGRLTGAAAYLGLREKGDQTELTDWLRENCADLTSELPFLLEIPSERVLGAGYGKLFCIVPRDENTSLAVNHVTWQMMGNGLHPCLALCSILRSPVESPRSPSRCISALITPATSSRSPLLMRSIFSR